MTSGGAGFATDGYTFVGFDQSGNPLGDPVIIDPPLGLTFSPLLTDNGVVILTSRDSNIAGYLTNGVPHASITLAAVVAGIRGKFVPTGQPAVNGSRIYVSAQFQPDNGQRWFGPAGAPHASNGLQCRLFAIDVHRTLNERLQVRWNVSIPCWKHARVRGLTVSDRATAGLKADGTNITDASAPLLVHNGLVCVAGANPGDGSQTGIVTCIPGDNGAGSNSLPLAGLVVGISSAADGRELGAGVWVTLAGADGVASLVLLDTQSWRAAMVVNLCALALCKGAAVVQGGCLPGSSVGPWAWLRAFSYLLANPPPSPTSSLPAPAPAPGPLSIICHLIW